jgi:hypothetical protein
LRCPIGAFELLGKLEGEVTISLVVLHPRELGVDLGLFQLLQVHLQGLGYKAVAAPGGAAGHQSVGLFY